jgi:Uma2 family endonuclease
MPSDAASRLRMTAPEYLAWEREQTTKHEFHAGEVFAMAGGSPRHNFLSAAVIGELRSALKGRPCHVLSPDQRIGTPDGTRYMYADAVVVCGGVRTESSAPDVLTNPAIVVEVLSPSTEPYDRAEKWESYERTPSLSDYVLVAQNSVRVEHYRREHDGSWHYRVLGKGDTVALSDGATLSIDSIYAGAFELAAG